MPARSKVAVSAIRFLYRVTLKRPWDFDRGRAQPQEASDPADHSQSRGGVHFLGCVANVKQRTILTTCYAAGLRISEAVHLMPSAIDRQRMVIRIDQGKGRKDRYVMLSPKLLQVLSDYWHRVRPRGCLFPGRHPWAADHPQRGRIGLSSGARPLGPYQTGHAAFAPARLRRAFAGIRHQTFEPFSC